MTNKHGLRKDNCGHQYKLNIQIIEVRRSGKLSTKYYYWECPDVSDEVAVHKQHGHLPGRSNALTRSYEFTPPKWNHRCTTGSNHLVHVLRTIPTHSSVFSVWEQGQKSFFSKSNGERLNVRRFSSNRRTRNDFILTSYIINHLGANKSNLFSLFGTSYFWCHSKKIRNCDLKQSKWGCAFLTGCLNEWKALP